MTRPLDVLASAPRVALGSWPTPLQRCDRLREAIGGPEIWIKRDDCSGLAIGGNKTRKLEFLIGDAIAQGADGVITFGALQSNHARQTAAACAQLGLSCDLILTRLVARDDEAYTRSGNVMLDRLLGATVHEVDDPDAAFVRLGELLAEAKSAGRTLYTIVPGGSDAVGVLGYVAGTLELAEQVVAASLDAGRIVVAASTSGTAAGIVLGASVAGLDAVVDVECVYQPRDATQRELRSLIERGAERLGCAVPSEDRWTVSDAQLGGGYGITTSACLDAIALLARTEGVLLDPVYTGKAFASVLARTGERPSDAAVVFIHTGGVPGLFAYAPVIEDLIKEMNDG